MARKKNIKPVESHVLPGMETHVEEHELAKAEARGEELTAILATPRGSIDVKAGNIERHSPLFCGTGENPMLF